MILPAPDERVDTLPSGWLWKLFGELVTHSQNGVSKRRSVTGNPTPVLRLADVREGEIDESSPREIRLSDEEIKKYVLQVGDLLCVRVNGSRSITGRLVYFRSRKVWAYCDHFIRFRLNPDIGYSKYLAHYFNTEAVRRYLGEHMVSTAGQNTVSQGTVLGVAVPVAPVNQQRAVVAEIEKQFSCLDEAVATLKRVKANLKRYKAAVLKAAVEGKLTEDWRKQHPNVEPASKRLERILAERRAKWNGRGKYKEPAKPDTSNLSLLPEKWTWASIDQLTSHITSGSRDWTRYYGRGSGTFILAQNVRLMRLDLSERQAVDPPRNDAETTRTRVSIGDILVTIVGAKTGEVCHISKELVDHFVCQSVALLRPLMPASAKFMELYLASQENGQAQWKQYIYGQGRPHLSFKQLKMTAIALPPLVEQQQAVAEVECRLSVIDELEAAVEANLTRADRLRQAVLSQAFSGRLVGQNSKNVHGTPSVLSVAAESLAGYGNSESASR